MKFGVNTMIWSGAIDESIPMEAIKNAQVDVIEVPVFSSSDVPVDFLKKPLDELNLECTFCSVNPPGKNPISNDKVVRAETVEHWKEIIRTATEVGADLIAGPTYSPVGFLPGRRRTEEEWKWGIDFHQQLAPLLEETGIQLAIEPLNRFETYFLNTVDDAVRFVDQIGCSNIGILVDTFHSNIEEKDVPGAYRACGSRLKHVHTCENDRGIPGTGHTNWKGVLQTLKDMGYNERLTIESFNSTIPELAAATAIWRDLAPALDDIAFEGTRFLRKQWAVL